MFKAYILEYSRICYQWLTLINRIGNYLFSLCFLQILKTINIYEFIMYSHINMYIHLYICRYVYIWLCILSSDPEFIFGSFLLITQIPFSQFGFQLLSLLLSWAFVSWSPPAVSNNLQTHPIPVSQTVNFVSSLSYFSQKDF